MDFINAKRHFPTVDFPVSFCPAIRDNPSNLIMDFFILPKCSNNISINSPKETANILF